MKSGETVFSETYSPAENKFKVEDILFLANLNESLATVDIESVYDKLALMIKRYMEVKEIKIYHFNLGTQSLRLKLYVGSDPDPERSFFIAKDPQLAQAIFYSKSIRSHSNQNSDLYSMFLKVKNVPMALVQVDTMWDKGASNEEIQLFEGLINFAGKILESNELVSDLYSQGLETKFIDRIEFELMLSYEKRRKELFGTEYSLVTIDLSNKDFDFISGKLLEFIRETDYVTYEFKTEKLLFLLPCTPESGKKLFQERIHKLLAEYNIK